MNGWHPWVHNAERKGKAPFLYTKRERREYRSRTWRFLYRLKDWTDEWEFSLDAGVRIEVDDREDDR